MNRPYPPPLPDERIAELADASRPWSHEWRSMAQEIQRLRSQIGLWKKFIDLVRERNVTLPLWVMLLIDAASKGTEMKLKPGWLDRQFENVEKEVSQWPDSMKQAAGFDTPNPRDERIKRLEEALADAKLNFENGVYKGYGISRIDRYIKGEL